MYHYTQIEKRRNAHLYVYRQRFNTKNITEKCQLKNSKISSGREDIVGRKLAASLNMFELRIQRL